MKRLQLVAQVFTNALVRRRHEQSLRESEERLALAADSAEAGLWTLDYDSGVFWSTKRARAIFGYSPDEPVTMERLAASVHPDDWDRVRAAIERSARRASLSTRSTGSCCLAMRGCGGWPPGAAPASARPGSRRA